MSLIILTGKSSVNCLNTSVPKKRFKDDLGVKEGSKSFFLVDGSDALLSGLTALTRNPPARLMVGLPSTIDRLTLSIACFVASPTRSFSCCLLRITSTVLNMLSSELCLVVFDAFSSANNSNNVFSFVLGFSNSWPNKPKEIKDQVQVGYVNGLLI